MLKLPAGHDAHVPADAPPQPLRCWPATHDEAEQLEQTNAPAPQHAIMSRPKDKSDPRDDRNLRIAIVVHSCFICKALKFVYFPFPFSLLNVAYFLFGWQMKNNAGGKFYSEWSSPAS